MLVCTYASLIRVHHIILVYLCMYACVCMHASELSAYIPSLGGKGGSNQENVPIVAYPAHLCASAILSWCLSVWLIHTGTRKYEAVLGHVRKDGGIE